MEKTAKLSFGELFTKLHPILTGIMLLYILFQVYSIKKIARSGRTEIDFVTSKLDYVTSDINNTSTTSK